MDVYGLMRRCRFGTLILCLGASLAVSSDHAASLFKDGYTQQSLKEYKQYISKNADDEHAWKDIACLASDLALLEDERNALASLYRIPPPSMWVPQRLGWNALARGDAEEAVSFFGAALILQPLDFYSLLGLGMTYHMRGKLQEAAQVYRLLIAHYPESAVSRYLLATIDIMQDDFNAAERNLLDSLKKDYALAEAHFLLAKVYLNEGRTDDAWQRISTLLRIDPSSREVKQFIESPLFASIKEVPEKVPLAKKIKKHAVVAGIENRHAVPLIRVGLAVDEKGIPHKITAIDINVAGVIEATLGGGKKVRVETQENSEWRISVSTGSSMVSVFDQEGSLAFSTTDYIAVAPGTPRDTVIIRGIPYATGFAWAGLADREYRGVLFVLPRKDRLLLINQLPFEEYLFSVLPSEMISSWPVEALKAQAVIARCFAWHKKQHPPHGTFGYDVCSSQHCQVYSGVRNETERTNNAVIQTRGEILLYKNRIANTLYSSNCGGRTQSSRDLKGWGYEPFLTGVSDVNDPYARCETPSELYSFIHDADPPCYCAPSSYTYTAESRWVRIIPAEYVTERVNRYNKVGTVQDIAVLRRAPSGHIREIRIKGSQRSVVVEKENLIRGMFAPGGLRSTFFTVRAVRNNGKVHYFVFQGGGWGHGVGLCQSGAAGMAEEKKTYREILYHYYRGTALKKLPW